MKEQNLTIKITDGTMKLYKGLEPGEVVVVPGGYILNDIFTNQNVFYEEV